MEDGFKYEEHDDINTLAVTHQFPFLHTFHYHQQDLLGLAFAIIECLLNSN